MCDDHVILTTTTIYETNEKLQTKLTRMTRESPVIMTINFE